MGTFLVRIGNTRKQNSWDMTESPAIALHAACLEEVTLLRTDTATLEKKRLAGGSKATTRAWWISAAGNTVTGRSLPIKKPEIALSKWEFARWHA